MNSLHPWYIDATIEHRKSVSIPVVHWSVRSCDPTSKLQMCSIYRGVSDATTDLILLFKDEDLYIIAKLFPNKMSSRSSSNSFSCAISFPIKVKLIYKKSTVATHLPRLSLPSWDLGVCFQAGRENAHPNPLNQQQWQDKANTPEARSLCPRAVLPCGRQTQRVYSFFSEYRLRS